MTARIDGSTRTPTFSTELPVITSGGPASDVARLQLALLDRQEESASTQRRAGRETARALGRAQVAEQRRAADLQLAAGLTRAAASAVSAGIDLASSMKSDRAADAQFRADNAGADVARANDARTEPAGPGESGASTVSLDPSRRAAAKHVHEASRLRNEATRIDAAGKAISAGAQAIAATLDHAASRAEIRATEAGQLAEIARQTADDAGDHAAQAARRSDRLIESLSQIAQARAEAMRNATA